MALINMYIHHSFIYAYGWTYWWGSQRSNPLRSGIYHKNRGPETRVWMEWQFPKHNATPFTVYGTTEDSQALHMAIPVSPIEREWSSSAHDQVLWLVEVPSVRFWLIRHCSPIRWIGDKQCLCFNPVKFRLHHKNLKNILCAKCALCLHSSLILVCVNKQACCLVSDGGGWGQGSTNTALWLNRT